MATLEQKQVNRIRLSNIILSALGVGLWDLLGDAAPGLATKFGESILQVMEKEMGLELAGDSVEVWAAEIGRLYTDEFGAGTAFNVKATENSIYVEAYDCMFGPSSDALIAGGIAPFVCPVRAVCSAALVRLGKKVRPSEVKREGNKCWTTYEYY